LLNEHFSYSVFTSTRSKICFAPSSPHSSSNLPKIISRAKNQKKHEMSLVQKYTTKEVLMKLFPEYYREKEELIGNSVMKKPFFNVLIEYYEVSEFANSIESDVKVDET
jgi:hypothetical protein